MTKANAELIDPKKIASEIRDHHEACIGAGHDALQHAKKAGLLLTALKKSKAIPHGEWTSWVESTFRFSVRAAQQYMQIAEKWPLIEESQKRTGGSLLALRDARELIAEPKKSAPSAPAATTTTPSTSQPDPAVDVSGWDEPTEEAPTDPAVSFYEGEPDEPEGWQVPDPKEAAKPFDILIRELNEWEKRAVANLVDSSVIGTEFFAKGDFKTRVSNLRELLQTRRPYCVCPKCNGERCELCRQSGLVPKRFSEKGSVPVEASA